jgi:hypothetical protein
MTIEAVRTGPRSPSAGSPPYVPARPRGPRGGWNIWGGDATTLRGRDRPLTGKVIRTELT